MICNNLEFLKKYFLIKNYILYILNKYFIFTNYIFQVFKQFISITRNISKNCFKRNNNFNNVMKKNIIFK